MSSSDASDYNENGELDDKRWRFDVDVRDELHRLRVRRAAEEALRAEAEPKAPPFDAGTLREVMARPADPPMRVEGLIPSDASTLVVAQRKTGKTTLELNWARSLLMGEPFLGRFPVRPIDGMVALLNYEVSAAQIARWAADTGMPADRLYLVNLRGRRNPLTHQEDRERLADDLKARGAEALIVDPFGRAYTGKSQNDPGEVGAWLVDLDLFARAEVGATDLMLCAHAGWNGERTRGASSLEDWADSIITLARDPDDETLRFMRAIGRDVEHDEDQLLYDPDTRLLTLAGAGSRKHAKETRKLDDLGHYARRAARENPGLGVSEMVKAIREMDDAPAFHEGDVSKAAKHMAEQGLMRVEPGGPGKKTQHFSLGVDFSPTPADPRQTPAAQDPLTPATPAYRAGVGVGSSGDDSTLAAVGVEPQDDEPEDLAAIVAELGTCPVCGRFTCECEDVS